MHRLEESRHFVDPPFVALLVGADELSGLGLALECAEGDGLFAAHHLFRVKLFEGDDEAVAAELERDLLRGRRRLGRLEEAELGGGLPHGVASLPVLASNALKVSTTALGLSAISLPRLPACR